MAHKFENRKGGEFEIRVFPHRDDLLTDFGKATLSDRYLLPGETYQELFARVSAWFADDEEHANRLYHYISNLWLMPSTPVLSNGGTDRGLPISCFLNTVGDSMESILHTYHENGWLAARGGGIGTDWSQVRSIGERVGLNGHTSGVVPFLKVMDSQTLAISQGSQRRGSAAAYLRIDHPEIEEFIDLRRATGDANRRALNLHHGVAVTDEFMIAVRDGAQFDLLSPRDGSVVKTVDARALWVRLLLARVETGEPYLLFIDTVNRSVPAVQKDLGLQVRQSNLCVEITLPTGVDHIGRERTAVCCLASLNMETYDEWAGKSAVVADALRFLDNVLQDFIDRTEGVPGFERARYSAMRERSVGLGIMGFHSYLQKRNVPFESALAKSINMRFWKWLREQADITNHQLGQSRGPNLDAWEAGVVARFSNMFAVAPTASISIIAANASPGVEPYAANSFTQKTLSGSFSVKNRYLDKLIEDKWRDTGAREHQSLEEFKAEVWSRITTAEGSIQHLTDLFDQHERDVFKTAFELDQRWILEHAADRTPYICQSQSINVFLPANVSKRDLHMLHFSAWQKGIKSLYYCRSKSVGRADVVSHLAGTMPTEAGLPDPAKLDYDECLACQ